MAQEGGTEKRPIKETTILHHLTVGQTCTLVSRNGGDMTEMWSSAVP